MDKPWKVISAFVGVFIAGAVFGGFFTLRSSEKWLANERAQARVAPPPAKAVPARGPAVPPPAAPPGQSSPLVGRIAPQVMRQFTQRLSPTPEQRKAIQPIVGRAAEDLQRMQREHLADTARTTERMYVDVSALLTTEQRTKLEHMRQEMLERVRREKEKRGEVQPGAEVNAKPNGNPARPNQQNKVEKNSKPEP